MEMIKRLQLTRLQAVVVFAKRALAWVGVVGLVFLSGYLFYFYLEAKADWRVETAKLEGQVQMLEGEINHLSAVKSGLEIEGEKLQADALDQARSKYTAQ